MASKLGSDGGFETEFMRQGVHEHMMTSGLWVSKLMTSLNSAMSTSASLDCPEDTAVLDILHTAAQSSPKVGTQ
eukprot:6214610-Amphidinium_carterae.2